MTPWRPLPGDPPPPRRLGDSLDRIARSLGGPGAGALTAIFSRWTDIVGPAVAAHARPLALSRGTLTIACEQPAWAAQLAYLEADLKRRIDDVAGPGTVTRIRVTVRPK
ncbi:MAG: DciA family protein [Acidimicrobiia bacterium]